MEANKLTEQFLKSVAGLENSTNGKWAFSDFKTPHGIELRNGFLDACSELFVPFAGQPQPIIYHAICLAFVASNTTS